MTAPRAPTITLETPRVRLRQWQDSDLEPFAQINADPKVMAYFLKPLDRLESDALADRLRTLIQENGWGVWALELKSSGQFIGFVGLHIPSPDFPFSPCAEIAWRLDYRYWGKGLALEAAQAALHVGFNALSLDEIVAFTSLPNKRSQNLMARMGMHYAQTFIHPHVPQGHPLQTHCLYRIKKLQFLTSQ